MSGAGGSDGSLSTEKGKTMINRIKDLIRLRKQNDAVKIMLFFFLAGITSAFSILYHAREIYYFVNTPAEYVLSSNQIISGKQVQTLLQMKDVVRISRQLDTSLTIKYRGKEAVISAVLLSQDYIEKMYDTTLPSGAKRIFLDPVSFENLQQEWSEDGVEGVGIDSRQAEHNEGMDVRYAMMEMLPDQTGETAEDILTDQPARLIVTKPENQEGEGLVCLVGSESQLLKGANGLRIQFRSHDLDGLQVDHLEKLGYQIENEERVMEQEFAMKMKLLHIRYGLLILGGCLVAVFAIRKWGVLIGCEG